MDIVKELFGLLIEYGTLLLEYLAPFKVEIVVGLVFVTFVFGFISSFK